MSSDELDRRLWRSDKPVRQQRNDPPMSWQEMEAIRQYLGLTILEWAKAIGCNYEGARLMLRGERRITGGYRRMARLAPHLPRLMLYALASGATPEQAATEPEKHMKVKRRLTGFAVHGQPKRR